MISTTARIKIFSGNDTATEFAVTEFVALDTSHLEVVYIDSDDTETVLVEDTDYSVTLEESGLFSVTYPLSGDPLTTGDSLRVTRHTPRTQELNLSASEKLPVESLERALDKAALMVQDVADISVGISVEVEAEDVGYTPAGTGAVTTTVQAKLRESVSVKDFGAVGDGVTDDTAKFTLLEAHITGQVIDLAGLSYKVSTYPAGNTYVNGAFVIGANTLSAAQSKAVISCGSPIKDTGAVDPPYSGGVQNTLVFSGRTTDDVFALIASQSSRASGPARAVCIGSIYSWAKGNVSGVYSSRQSSAVHAQSVALGTEECEGYGTRSGNVSSVFCRTEGLMGLNLSSRRGYANNLECAANIASRDVSSGQGHGAVFNVNVSDGVITSVDVVSGGADYVSPTINFYDRGGIGLASGATANATVVGGVITAVTVTSGGTEYSSEVLALAQVSTQCHVNVASRYTSAVGELSGNLMSEQSKTTGFGAGAISSRGVLVSGQNSAAIACGAPSVALGDTVVSGANAANIAAQTSINAGELSLIAGSWISETGSNSFGAVVLGSRRVLNNVTRSVCGGNSSTGSASTANRKWHLFGDTGNIQAAGTISGSTTFTDYAEYFENLESGVVPLGTLVALAGRKVRSTSDGDEILGVVSATALVSAGDSPFTWSQRYLTGEFGEPLYDEIPDPDWEPIVPDWNAKAPLVVREGSRGEEFVVDPEWSRPTIPNPVGQGVVKVLRENPAFDPAQQNIPRSQRPNEWTCVGLLGQVHVRVDADVQVGDFIAAGNGGTGVKSATATNTRCMEIRKPFDDTKGYAVAFCLLK